MYNQNKSYELTTDQLKKFEGFENITDEEAKETIFCLKELSRILFGMFTKSIEKESEQFVNFFPEEEGKNPYKLKRGVEKKRDKKLLTKNIQP
jgi:hypothetical protein